MSGAPRAKFPKKLGFLFEPKRYKILYGGRGGAKSWGVARALLILGSNRVLRIVCAREFQKSIADSVHQLLSDQIEALGLDSFYEIQQTCIKGRNGTEFVFHGLKHNINNIKSLEGCDICWVEEAANVSRASWNKLIPTIRKDGSEIWVTFNPELETDETYERFVRSPPDNAAIVKIDYSDNPFLPQVLRDEIEQLQRRNVDDYLHVYGGHCKQTLEGAIFAAEMRDAMKAGRICRVPYTPTKPVNTFWDLGWSDSVAIWFIQRIGFEYRVIDYLEDSQKTLGWYIQECQKKGYVYDLDHFPHDGKHKTLASGGKSLEQQARELGRKVRTLPTTALSAQINAARTVFANCYFDEDKCADGLNALRHYRYEVDENGQFSKTPLHDWSSHGASAFMSFGISANERAERKKTPEEHMRMFGGHDAGWMAN